MAPTYIKCLLGACLAFSFILGCLVNWAPSETPCDCHDLNGGQKHVEARVQLPPSDRPKLAIIVPFRDRFEELLQFAPHMERFLNAQGVPHHIFVMNQVDRYRFNRASLINTGFLLAEQHFDYIAMHDVDLLPQNPDLHYEYPKLGPLHIAAPELHPKYHYPTFVGGILLVSKQHFRLMNGMSNKYWGWGLEDDEFYVRIMDAGLKVQRPENIKTGPEDTFKHIHDRAHRRRDMVKCYNQREETRRRDHMTGLDTLKYSIQRQHNLVLDGTNITVVNVELHCDQKTTPWCDCEGAPKDTAPPKGAAKKPKKR